MLKSLWREINVSGAKVVVDAAVRGGIRTKTAILEN